jgi:hypothetical protein
MLLPCIEERVAVIELYLHPSHSDSSTHLL